MLCVTLYTSCKSRDKPNQTKGKKMKILTKNARAFADACHENSSDELMEALNGEADSADCATWEITAEEWRAAIEMARSEIG